MSLRGLNFGIISGPTQSVNNAASGKPKVIWDLLHPSDFSK